MISLVLADDHPIVLDGLEQLFHLEPEFRVVARCRSGVETLAAVRTFAPDVLVLDVQMPRGDGISVLREMAGERRRTRTVLLTAALDDAQLVTALELGAAGVVLKEEAPEVLVAAVRQVHRGGRWLDEATRERALDGMLERRGTAGAPSGLTPRELEIVRMVVAGRRNREIAESLGISEGTVKIHLHNVYEKLGIDGRVQLALQARSMGIG